MFSTEIFSNHSNTLFCEIKLTLFNRKTHYSVVIFFFLTEQGYQSLAQGIKHLGGTLDSQADRNRTHTDAGMDSRAPHRFLFTLNFCVELFKGLI
jgi:hypothetical protein